MKKLNVLFLAGATALAFQACNSSDKSSTTIAKDSNEAKKNSGMMAANDDSTKAGGAVLKTDEKDAEFAVKAANGGMAEVKMGQLAEQKATNPEVKAFGAKMVTDHTKANDKLMALAKEKNITLPATISNEEQRKMDELSKKTGKDFDRAYVNEMVDDHDNDVKEFMRESKDGKNTDLRSFAETTLPTLQMHQTMIKQIHKKYF